MEGLWRDKEEEKLDVKEDFVINYLWQLCAYLYMCLSMKIFAGGKYRNSYLVLVILSVPVSIWTEGGKTWKKMYSEILIQNL